MSNALLAILSYPLWNNIQTQKTRYYRKCNDTTQNTDTPKRGYCTKTLIFFNTDLSLYDSTYAFQTDIGNIDVLWFKTINAHTFHLLRFIFS